MMDHHFLGAICAETPRCTSCDLKTLVYVLKMPATLPFLLLTISLPKPSIIWHRAPDAEGKHYLQCTAQGEYAGSLFYLYQGGSREPMTEKKAVPTQSEVTFSVHSIGPSEQFQCSYEIWKGGKSIHSPLSNPANITEEHYPKPSIIVSPTTEIFAGQNWTIRCWAQSSGVNFVLYQAWVFRMEVTPRGDSSVAEFSLKNVSVADAGRYTCYYHSITEPVIWSNASDPVQLRVIEHYPKPSITVSPTTEVLAGLDWRIRCWAPSSGVNFVLYQDWVFRVEVTPRGDSNVAEFSLKNVSMADAGRYTCYYHSITEPVIWSNASDPVQLRVIDVAEVPDYQEVLVDTAGKYRVNCSVPYTIEGWFYLYRDGQLFAETRAWQDGKTISFNLTEELLSTTKGELSCQYGGNWLNDTEVWTQDSWSRSMDFTTSNSLRLGLGAILLLLALFFIADACWDKRN